MERVILGRTGLSVNKDGLSSSIIQRMSARETALILDEALSAGINFFDLAKEEDGEEKLGKVLPGRRDKLVIATKTEATTPNVFWSDLIGSLKALNTDYIDVYQFANIDKIPKEEDGTGMYEAMMMAKNQGRIRFVGVTVNRPLLARNIIESELYDTLQFPFCYLSGENERELLRLCVAKNIGFIAQDALGGGLIRDIALAKAWMSEFKSAVSIWRIKNYEELRRLIKATDESFTLKPSEREIIEQASIEQRDEYQSIFFNYNSTQFDFAH